MEPRLKNFRLYLIDREKHQPGLAYKGRGIETRQRDFAHFINMVYELEPTPAGKDEIPLLQYGMFYDGQHLFYNQIVISTLTQEQFNQALLNHMIHFIQGACFTLPKNPTSSRLEWLKSSNALIMAHFGLTSVRVIPKYSQSAREEFYEKIFKDKCDDIVFAPHPDSSNYFWSKFYQGEIELQDPFYVREENKYDTTEGVVVKATTPYGYITLGKGLELDTNKNKQVVVVFRNEDGTTERGNFMSKRGKELRELKEVFDTLCGTLDI